MRGQEGPRTGFDPQAAELAAFASSGSYGLAEKCLKMAQALEYPGLDIPSYMAKLELYGRQAWAACPRDADIGLRIGRLNDLFFGALEFGSEDEDYYNPKNNFLNEVIDKKSGIPITLSVIYADMARRAGLELELVGFPGRVLLKAGEYAVIDPYGRGRRVGSADLQEMLDGAYEGRVKMRPHFLNALTDGQAIARIARNLRSSYLQSYDYERANRCADAVLATDPGFAEDAREKGIIEGRLLRYGSAVEYLERYLYLSPDAADADAVLEAIRDLRGRA